MLKIIPDEYTGCIFLTFGKRSFLSHFVSGLEIFLKGKKFPLGFKFIPSHTGIILAQERDHLYYIAHSSIGGVQISKLNLDPKEYKYIIAKPKFDLPNCAETCFKLLGYQYGYKDYFFFALDVLFSNRIGKRWHFSKKYNNTRKIVCSEFVAFVYYLCAKYRFVEVNRKGNVTPLKPSLVTPIDVLNTVLLKEEDFEILEKNLG